MVEWSAIALEPAGGGGEDMMLIGRDMSAQLRAEHERREAMRAAAMGTWTADGSLATISWSDELYELVGVDPDEFVPSLRSCWALLDAERAGAGTRRLRRLLTSAAVPVHLSDLVDRPTATARFMEVEGRRVRIRPHDRHRPRRDHAAPSR